MTMFPLRNRPTHWHHDFGGWRLAFCLPTGGLQRKGFFFWLFFVWVYIFVQLCCGEGHRASRYAVATLELLLLPYPQNWGGGGGLRRASSGVGGGGGGGGCVWVWKLGECGGDYRRGL